MTFLYSLSRFLGLPLYLCVRLYQMTLSPDHGWLKIYYPNGYCRFHPSCSAYAAQGLRTTGIVALPRIVWRLVRCQPWSLGGLDPYRDSHAPNNIR